MIPGMAHRAYLLALMVVIALGAYLRLVDLGGPSLWHDEIIHFQTAESLAQQPWFRHLTGVREVLHGRTENGFAYYGLQMLGQRLATGEAGVRLLPAIIGILTLPLMALTGQLVGGRLVGLLATFVLAVSPLHVYFSREGRPYSLFMLLALVLLCALLQKGSRVGIGMAYGGCLAAAYVGVHSVPMLLAFLFLSIVGLVWGLRSRVAVFKSPYLHYVIAATLALGLVYGLYMAPSRASTVKLDKLKSPGNQLESPVHLSPVSQLALERFLASMTTSGHQSVLMKSRSWMLLALSLVGVLAGMFRRPRETIAIAGMFLLPACLSIALLVSVNRWYGLRYTTPALPAFLLLVALGIAAIAHFVGRMTSGSGPQTPRKLVTWLTAAILLLLFVAPNVTAARVDPHRKLDWRGVAQFFDAVALEGEPVLVPNLWPQICLGYYLQDLGRDVEFVNLWESSALGERQVAERPRGWMLTAGFRQTNEVRAWMHQFVPVLKKREEEMALFFYPDFVTLLETRFAAQKGTVFEEQFTRMGKRFDFAAGEMLLQGQGWSYPERNTAGIDYQWALGERAELGLPIGRPRDARIRLRVLPFTYPEAPPQTLEMRLNEEPLVTLELTQGWSEHEVGVPASSWSSGANILYLRLARSTIPAQQGTGSTDQRNLSAAFDFLEVVTEDTDPTLP
jgi:4-amino-4-deoxy-L-arabinose transferase-like glycosyltransferase